MSHIIDQGMWLRGLKRNRLAAIINIFQRGSMNWILLTPSLEIKIRSKLVRIFLMVELSHETSEPKFCSHFGLNCLRVRK